MNPMTEYKVLMTWLIVYNKLNLDDGDVRFFIDREYSIYAYVKNDVDSMQRWVDMGYLKSMGRASDAIEEGNGVEWDVTLTQKFVDLALMETL